MLRVTAEYLRRHGATPEAIGNPALLAAPASGAIQDVVEFVGSPAETLKYVCKLYLEINELVKFIGKKVRQMGGHQ